MSTKGFSLQNNSPTNHKDQLHRHPRNDILGIDFWHAVEFSKFGRTSPPHTKHAGHQGRPTKLPACILGVKSVTRSPSGRTRAHLAFGGSLPLAGFPAVSRLPGGCSGRAGEPAAEVLSPRGTGLLRAGACAPTRWRPFLPLGLTTRTVDGRPRESQIRGVGDHQPATGSRQSASATGVLVRQGAPRRGSCGRDGAGPRVRAGSPVRRGPAPGPSP